MNHQPLQWACSSQKSAFDEDDSDVQIIDPILNQPLPKNREPEELKDDEKHLLNQDVVKRSEDDLFHDLAELIDKKRIPTVWNIPVQRKKP